MAQFYRTPPWPDAILGGLSGQPPEYPAPYQSQLPPVGSIPGMGQGNFGSGGSDFGGPKSGEFGKGRRNTRNSEGFWDQQGGPGAGVGSGEGVSVQGHADANMGSFGVSNPMSMTGQNLNIADLMLAFTPSAMSLGPIATAAAYSMGLLGVTSINDINHIAMAPPVNKALFKSITGMPDFAEPVGLSGAPSVGDPGLSGGPVGGFGIGPGAAGLSAVGNPGFSFSGPGHSMSANPESPSRGGSSGGTGAAAGGGGGSGGSGGGHGGGHGTGAGTAGAGQGHR